MRDDSLHSGTTTQLWYELVRDGEARTQLQLPDMLESYLVFVLQRHQGDALLGGRTMALECLNGMQCSGRDRADALRDVGDRCLLIAGLYPKLARRRNVQPNYYVALGQSAYGEVAAVARAGHAALFEQLARRFDAMRRVLSGIVAPASLAADASVDAHWQAFATRHLH